MHTATEHAVAHVFWSPSASLRRELLTQRLRVPQSADGDGCDGGVTLHFTSGAHPPVKARLLVGADGSQSGVRAQLLGDGPPLFAGGRARMAWGAGRCWRGLAGAGVLALGENVHSAHQTLSTNKQATSQSGNNAPFPPAQTLPSGAPCSPGPLGGSQSPAPVSLHPAAAGASACYAAWAAGRALLHTLPHRIILTGANPPRLTPPCRLHFRHPAPHDAVLWPGGWLGRLAGSATGGWQVAGPPCCQTVPGSASSSEAFLCVWGVLLGSFTSSDGPPSMAGPTRRPLGPGHASGWMRSVAAAWRTPRVRRLLGTCPTLEPAMLAAWAEPTPSAFCWPHAPGTPA